MTQDNFFPVHSSALSYNQQGQKKNSNGKSPKPDYLPVPKVLIASHGSVGPHDTVAATKAFCDKIRIVGPVGAGSISAPQLSVEERSALLQNLWSAAYKKLHPKKADDVIEAAKFKVVKVDGYKAGKTRVGSDNASAVVGVAAGKLKTKSGFHLILEFNPHRLKAEGLASLEPLSIDLRDESGCAD